MAVVLASATLGLVSSRSVANLVVLLKKLRQRDGLTADRLRRNDSEHDELHQALTGQRRGVHADLDGLIDDVTMAARGLDPRDRAIVDLVLGLELSSPLGVGPSGERPDLTQRRTLLLREWSDRVGGNAPSETSLRTRLEEQALEALARSLTRGREINAEVGRAVVIGGAVIDHQLRVEDFPDLDEGRSSPVAGLEERPGGKGLTLAVALARLGFAVDLVAVVGQDDEGDEVIEFLRNEGVGTSYVDRLSGRTGRVTMVTHTGDGRSFALAWMNRDELFLKPELARDAIGDLGVTDNVLFTLEPRFSAIRSALDSLPGRRDQRPRVLMVPAPAGMDGKILQVNAFERVDYIVGHTEELGQLVDHLDSTEDQASFLRRRASVETVVVADVGRATAYGDFDTVEKRAPDTLVRELAGAREAFAAAFLRQMARLDRQGLPPGDRIDDAMAWGMAAMEHSAMQPGVVAGMPDEAGLRRFLAS